jgi:hypothetical protein
MRVGRELQTFLDVLFPEVDLFALLRLDNITTFTSSGTGNSRFNLSVIVKAFEADVRRMWATKAGWRWEEENVGEWEPHTSHQGTSHGPRRESPGLATDVLRKVKLILVRFQTSTNVRLCAALPLELHHKQRSPKSTTFSSVSVLVDATVPL